MELHLLGYDHQDEDEATNMETLEIRILQKMNIQKPLHGWAVYAMMRYACNVR